MQKTSFWIFRIIPAFILIQTLFFKFSSAPESVYIFETLGIEPWGRIGSGIVELIAAILLLIPATSGLGALLGLGIISGAILSHITKLGIEVQGDGGTLFYLALIVFICCIFVTWQERKKIPLLNQNLK